MKIDRVELQDSARRIFAEGALMPDRDKSWDSIVEMGWLALSVPEDLGGLGEEREALAILHMELGRVLAPASFLAAALAVEAIAGAEGFAGREEWIGRLIGGELVTASLGGSAAEGETALSGTLDAVPDADKASHVLMASETLIVLVPTDAAGLSVAEQTIWDDSRRLFTVTLANVAVDDALVVSRGPEAARIIEGLREHLYVALAADSLGGAAALLSLTIDYLQMRRQFGRPLALFQALKHRCADLKALLDGAQALFDTSLAGRTGLPIDRGSEAGAVMSHVANTYATVAEEAVQLHGGIGLTAEHHCHRFQKRALLNGVLGGTNDDWLQVVGKQALERLG